MHLRQGYVQRFSVCPVTCIAKSWEDVALLVKLPVDLCDEDLHIRKLLFDSIYTFRGCKNAYNCNPFGFPKFFSSLTVFRSVEPVAIIGSEIIIVSFGVMWGIFV